jgi:hypothetical protein
MKGRPTRPRIQQVISGGQTGADRAALDWALTVGLPHGGFCPSGRISEDGQIPARYRLNELPSDDYAARTRANVLGSDATVIFSIRPALANGSLLTQRYAEELGKPCLHLHAHEGVVAAERRLGDFVKRHAVAVLNVAGPRASEEACVGDFVTAVLSATFLPLRDVFLDVRAEDEDAEPLREAV